MPRSPMLFGIGHRRGVNCIEGLGGASLVEVVCVCVHVHVLLYADDINWLESLRTTSSLKECLWNMLNSIVYLGPTHEGPQNSQQETSEA